MHSGNLLIRKCTDALRLRQDINQTLAKADCSKTALGRSHKKAQRHCQQTGESRLRNTGTGIDTDKFDEEPSSALFPAPLPSVEMGYQHAVVQPIDHSHKHNYLYRDRHRHKHTQTYQEAQLKPLPGPLTRGFFANANRQTRAQTWGQTDSLIGPAQPSS